ncbi:MAG: glycosyltransferase family 4 protein, partial [Pseudomonadota bacterium]
VFRHHVAVIRNGQIQLQLVDDAPARRKKLDGPLTIGMLAELTHRKAQDVAIEALARLRAGGINARLVCAGSGSSELLENLAKQLNVSSKVEFLGWADPVRFLNTLDVFCFPSRAEPFGIALIEAMAQGVPVVASDVDGPADILADGSGLLVPPGNAEALANAIGRIARDETLAAQLSDRGRQRVLSHYSPEAVGQSIVSAFREFGAQV